MVTSAAPSHAQVVAIVPKGAPGWLRNLTDHCGFTAAPGVRAVLRRASRDELPACIIGAPSVRVLTMFQSLRDAMEPPYRPLLVILSHLPAPISGADYVWAPEPAILQHNLDAALAIRAAWQRSIEQLTPADDGEFERRLQMQAQELELLKATIIQSVAHELRTPMLHVKGAVSLLSETEDPQKLGELLLYATASTARLEGVISNLILLSEAFTSIELEDVFLPDSLEIALRNLRRTWAHRESAERVQAIHPPQLPLVQGNRRALSIVLQLLLDNALKFSDDVVDVEFTPGESHMQVCVRDRGIGIEPDRHERIFESFYQADGSSTRKHGGMGVGLAIARQIVEAHGGRIVVISAPRAGSEFMFSLAYTKL
ncbi:MAG: HAMP domain-containing histidine kinase [Anaerolineae bacterium]|nr:HAMP domain-containing histidine kinase [Anaerolineae bacterium]